MSDPFNPFTKTSFISGQSPVFQQASKDDAPIDAEFVEVPVEEKSDDEERVAEIRAALDDHTYFYRQALGLITPSMLCNIIGVDIQTLKRWRAIKKGPAYLRIGKRVWYHIDDIAQWLPSQRVTDHISTEETTMMSGQRRDYSKDDNEIVPEQQPDPNQPFPGTVDEHGNPIQPPPVPPAPGTVSDEDSGPTHDGNEGARGGSPEAA